MHVMLLGDVITFAFCLFVMFAAIFVAAFVAAMSSAPALTLGEESELLADLSARVARIGYEVTYSRVMREVEAREAREDAAWEASKLSVESAAPVAAARPPRGLVRPPTAEMRAAARRRLSRRRRGRHAHPCRVLALPARRVGTGRCGG